MTEYEVDEYIEDLGMTLGESLLSIHKSYLPILDGVLDEKWLVGISHITGGGIINNTNRILEDNHEIHIDWDSWEIPAIFNLIQDLGNVPIDDMRQSMNLGLGIIYIVKPEASGDFESHMKLMNESFYNIGIVK